jgi:hypothetical protein
MTIKQNSNLKRQTQTRSQWRSVALPVEHGGWGFLLEPLLLGLLVAPSAAAVTLSVAVIAAFLLRQPAKIILMDRRRGRAFPRTQLAWRFVLLYGSFALIGVALTLWQAGFVWLLPSLLALPFGAVFLYYDLTRPGRTWQAEFSAPVALTSATASIALIAGWALWPSLALWIMLTARALPSILFVRARLRLDRDKAPDRILPILAHVVALIVVLALAWVEWIPWLGLIPYVVLLVRAIHGLSAQRWRTSIKAIGFMELGIGIGTVLMIAAGYWIES